MRLTEKNKMAKYGYRYLGGIDNFGEGCQKLGQLEDIMEKYNFESVEELDDFLTHNVIYGKWRSKL